MVCRDAEMLTDQNMLWVDIKTYCFMKNLLHQLSDDFGRRGQDGGFMLRFAGFQDGVQGYPAVG